MRKDLIVENIREIYNNIPLKFKNAILYHLYDFFVYLSHNYPHKFANRFIRQVCRRFSLKGKRILDVGSFTGYYSFYFHCERNRVTGVELSNKVLYARQRYSFYSIDFIHGNINDELLKFEGNKFDFIFCSNLPLHYDSGSVESSELFDEFMGKVMECLAPGGVLFYIFFSTKEDNDEIPINEVELAAYCIAHNIDHYTIESTTLLGRNTVELTVRKVPV